MCSMVRSGGRRVNHAALRGSAAHATASVGHARVPRPGRAPGVAADAPRTNTT
jgi:hypothetical protein